MLKNGKIIAGGHYDENKLYISPTLVTDIDFNSDIMQEEIFGPILPILPYNDINEIISVFRNIPKPLSTYVFSNNKKMHKTIFTVN